MNAPGDIFFAAYFGPSMNPTLREPEIIEVIPLVNNALRVGDVVYFRDTCTGQHVVHRVTRVMPAGISTRGDNNSSEDCFLLKPENIQGRVVAAWQGQKRRKIAGGLPGYWKMYWLRWRRLIDRHGSPLLHPVYRALSRRGGVSRILPSSFLPRILVFRIRGEERKLILLGGRVIGRYDKRTEQWWIKRPFRLLVDEKMLSFELARTNPDRDTPNQDGDVP